MSRSSGGPNAGMKRVREDPSSRSQEPERKRRRDDDYDSTRQVQWNSRGSSRGSYKNPQSTVPIDVPWTQEPYSHKNEQDNEDVDSDHEVDRVYPRDHDSEGHFKYVLGDSIGSVVDAKEPDRRRYKLLARIGQGTFGRVFSCWDRAEHRYVALKIVRAIKKYSHSAMIEIEILQKIKRETDAQMRQRRPDDEPSHYCVELLTWFKHSNHVCMVFDNFGPSVYDFMRDNEYRPYRMDTIREVANETLKSLQFLHDVVGLVHTDLKPENILFEEQGSLPGEMPSPRGLSHSTSGERKGSQEPLTPHDSLMPQSSTSSSSSSRSGSAEQKKSKKPYIVPKSNRIRVIDLGSAVYHNDHHGSIICTRNYRPPEVVLRLGWSSPADIWSLGCILLEMYTGTTLFQTHHNIEHLAMMERSLGPIPEDMITNPQQELPRSPPIRRVDADSSPFSGFRNSAVAKYYEETDESKVSKSSSLRLLPRAEAPSPSPNKVKLMFPTAQTARSAVAQVNITDVLGDIISEAQQPHFHDLIRQMLVHDPAKRITAAEALKHPFFA